VTWTLGAGSLVAAFAPMAVGAMRDASGGLTLPFALMAVLPALSAILALRAVAASSSYDFRNGSAT
jgi:cyanate permease